MGSRSRIDRLAEPLEGRLASNAEQVADLLPGMPGIASLLHAELEQLVGAEEWSAS